MPIPRLPREDVFLPVTTKMIVSISEIVSILKIVCIPGIISIPELHSGVSLVPNAWGGISVIRESRDSIALRDGCHRVWTRTGDRTSIGINVRPPVRKRW
jgi:hypothetical protein